MKIYSYRDRPPFTPTDVGSEPSLTQQKFTETQNINRMVDRYIRTGDPGALSQSQPPQYGDLTHLPETYLDALEIMRQTQEKFDALDPGVREYFRNDPKRMLEFLKHKENRRQAIKFGLIEPDPVTPPTVGEGGHTTPLDNSVPNDSEKNELSKQKNNKKGKEESNEPV